MSDDDPRTVRDRIVGAFWGARSEIWFASRTYPRRLRRYSISITRSTRSYRRWAARGRRRWTPEHREMFDYLERWPRVWRDAQPHLDSIRHSGHTMRAHAWDDVVRPVAGQTHEDLAYAFLPGALAQMAEPGERLIVCSSSWTAADGTRPKPLREFRFLDQAYWGSATRIDTPGECHLTHVFASMTTAGSAALDRVARTVVDTEALGVLVMPTDLRWVAYLYYAGIDVSAREPDDVRRFEQAAIAAGGRRERPDS